MDYFRHIFTNISRKIESVNQVKLQVRCLTTLYLYPVAWNDLKQIPVAITSHRFLKTWKVYMIVYISTILCEVANFCYRIHTEGKRSLGSILIRAMFVSCHCSGSVLLLSGISNQHSLGDLYKSIKGFRNKTGMSKMASFVYSTTQIKFVSVENFVQTAGFGISVIAIFLLPLVSFIFPCEMISGIVYKLATKEKRCDLVFLMLFSYVLEAILMLPPCLIGILMVTTFVQAIAPLSRYLQAIR